MYSVFSINPFLVFSFFFLVGTELIVISSFLIVILFHFSQLLEKFSIIQANVSWGVPLALICFGASMVYEEFKKRKKK